MRLFRRILLSAALPILAILLAAMFSPAGPPAASAAGEPIAVEVCHSAPQAPPSVAERAAGWLHTIVSSTRDLLS